MLDKMREILDRVAPGWFDEVYGPGAAAHRLTPKAKEEIEELVKEITPQIEAENRQRDLLLSFVFLLFVEKFQSSQLYSMSSE
jgi:hypothetical protein